MSRVALFCPGRGSYTKETMGRLSTALPFVQRAEELRARYELPSLVELDRAERFSPSRHLEPVNASALIWLRSMLDADRARHEHDVVLVGGNSMGWYTALAVCGALSFDDSFRLMQAMSLLQAEQARRSSGGQIVYPRTIRVLSRSSAAPIARCTKPRGRVGIVSHSSSRREGLRARRGIEVNRKRSLRVLETAG